jgi:DNA-binding CsgD family transcriptional regulator
MTLRKLGEGWTPPRSFVSTIVKNKVNDLVWKHYWDSADAETLKKKRAEQIFQREEVLALVHTLTQAEFKVFRLLGLGLSNEEVAQALFISPLTVRTHVKRIHAKCEIKGRAKLALAAYQACHHESTESRGIDQALMAEESGRFIRPGTLSQQVS